MTVSLERLPADGREVVAVWESWSPRDLETYRELGVPRLWVRGNVTDLDFLRDLPDLEVLSVIRQDLNDVDGIHALTNLRELSLDTQPSAPVDFSAFPRLERLFFRWRPGSDSLFASESLQSLYLYGCPDRDLSRIGRLATLQDLTVNSRKVASLEGIENLQQLKRLRLLQLSIGSLSGIDALSGTLERLEAELCRKVTDLLPVHGCPRLEFFSFANGARLASLLPLDGLTRLSAVLFPGSTVIDDGDLSVLTRLPALREVAFANRRHYSIRVEQLRQLLEARVV